MLKRTKVSVVALLICSFFFSVVPVRADVPSEQRYAGEILPGVIAVSSDSETVSYTRREVTATGAEKGAPDYHNMENLPNCCGPIAGAIVVGYYDRFFEELVPNYSTCYSTGTYKKMDRVYIPQLIRDLYDRMDTNVVDIGVSETEFKNGLAEYVEAHGRNITYTSFKKLIGVNESAIKSGFQAGEVAVLLCKQANVYIIDSSDNKDSISLSLSVPDHILVAYAYCEIKYYNGSDNFRTDHYFQVVTGLNGYSTGYVKIDNCFWLNEGCMVDIA